MIVSAFLSEAVAWIGAAGDGERCDSCGKIDVLESFWVKAGFDGQKVTRKARLCTHCMAKARSALHGFNYELKVGLE
ncbi:hypothetical protein [Maridesulfovibrio hydrothermalis]|uniref:Uncharacterized protein n=1 Tax=Maridesulfovibrio hydrothermalis AM13 = DSM 14728 TaxID=1121451 RepID=L0RFP4_9BACT|nr:hypothetical protein [Maridesulfovibrio hydrothermalis]CCO25015.1 conserved protein of unknown function [Maridesulfovibrio hydrothermalis AM13 = DSM 14728]